MRPCHVARTDARSSPRRKVIAEAYVSRRQTSQVASALVDPGGRFGDGRSAPRRRRGTGPACPHDAARATPAGNGRVVAHAAQPVTQAESRSADCCDRMSGEGSPPSSGRLVRAISCPRRRRGRPAFRDDGATGRFACTQCAASVATARLWLNCARRRRRPTLCLQVDVQRPRTVCPRFPLTVEGKAPSAFCERKRLLNRKCGADPSRRNMSGKES